MSVLITGMNGFIGVQAEISIGPGMEPYVFQSPIRGALDIALAEEELSYRVRYELKETLEDFIELVGQREQRVF